jgi:hypothetical protein
MKATYSRGLDQFTEQDINSKQATGKGVHSYIALYEDSFVSVKVNEINTIDRESYITSFTVWQGGNDYVDFLEWLHTTLG